MPLALQIKEEILPHAQSYNIMLHIPFILEWVRELALYSELLVLAQC